MLEGFVQIVLVNTIQPKMLGEQKRIKDRQLVTRTPQEVQEEIRTTMQYLIEVVEAI